MSKTQVFGQQKRSKIQSKNKITFRNAFESNNDVTSNIFEQSKEKKLDKTSNDSKSQSNISVSGDQAQKNKKIRRDVLQEKQIKEANQAIEKQAQLIKAHIESNKDHFTKLCGENSGKKTARFTRKKFT